MLDQKNRKKITNSSLSTVFGDEIFLGFQKNFFSSSCLNYRFLPVFEEYSKSNPKECLSVIVDEEPDVCEEYAIEYYPTVIMFKKGKVQKRLDAEPGVGLNQKQLKDLTEKQ